MKTKLPSGLVLKSLSKPLPRNRKKLHPKFRVKRLRPLDPSYKPDPESPNWVEREPRAAYDWARAEWLKGSVTVLELSEKLGCAEHRVRNWAYKRGASNRPPWVAEREEMEKKMQREAYKLNKDTYFRVLGETVRAIEHGIKKVNADEIQVQNIRDIQGLTNVAEMLHRMTQLEDGKPTEITARVKLTRADVLAKLKAADPLIFSTAKLEDADTSTVN